MIVRALSGHLKRCLCQQTPGETRENIKVKNGYVTINQQTSAISEELEAEDSGGVYVATLKPKNSWPNGRLRAAGTFTSESNVLLETMRWLLEKKNLRTLQD